MTMGAGLHLLIDGLSDKSLTKRAVQALLEQMPVTIGMTPILAPVTSVILLYTLLLLGIGFVLGRVIR